ncbi:MULTISPECIES: hypothetical protein [Planktothrix]|uniref:hypothetical protein n=1 Tax=Planktothrix TaxID=54304 RepID=UPI000423299B|nr:MULTISPECIES: hypothetical protein [Planktothrix]
MTDHLIYPTIDLYLYDLRQGLGQDLATLKENELVFLDKLPLSLKKDIISSQFPEKTKWKTEILEAFRKRDYPQKNSIKASPVPEKMEWKTEFVELLTEECEFTETLNLPPEYEGYYYPVQLSDTDALMVDCSVSDKKSNTSIEEITKLKEIIVGEKVLNYQGGSLGQTWLISGILPSDIKIESDDSDDVENLAQKCYNLLVEKKPDCQGKPQGKGKLLGGRFFEWNPDNLNDIPQKAPYNLEQKNPHVIIILYPNLEAIENAAELIDHWMQLFCHRHKILWAYVKSRVLKRDLEAKFVEVQSYVKDFKTQGYEGYNLGQLSKKVSDADNLFSDYAINLSYLEFQRSTIEVNLDNYRQQLKELVAKVFEKNPEYEVKCLEQFHSDARNKYLKQVRKDYENLSAGVKMLEVAVNLIRVNLQVREAKSDRTFQNTLGIVGAGLAAASVTASISGQFPNVVAPVTIIKSEEAKTLVEQNLGQVLRSLTIPESALMPFISLFLSLIIGLIGAGLTGLVIRLLGLRNHGKKR